MPHESYLGEVTGALGAIGRPHSGERVAEDRGSTLRYFGISFPARRRRVRDGFSFYSLPEAQVLEIWDAIWRASDNGDVLFAALDYYRPIVRRAVNPAFWPVMRGWIERVDNWAHADELAGLYSWLLAADHDEVYPQLVAWNGSTALWTRRISIVSLIHYSGKHAVFLPPERVLPLVTNCLEDDRVYVQLAVGWVLREMDRVYPEAVTAFLAGNAGRMGSRAFSRAIASRGSDERARLRALRAAEA